MKNQECMRELTPFLKDADIVVAAIGGTTLDWQITNPRDLNFFVSAAMGLAPSIALGFCLSQTERRVILLDGDGGLLMSLGSLATIAGVKPKNLKYIVFNNQLYGATGGLPLPNNKGLNFLKIAEGAGLDNLHEASTIDECKGKYSLVFERDGFAFLLLHVERTVPVVPDGFSFVSPFEVRYKILKLLNPLALKAV